MSSQSVPDILLVEDNPGDVRLFEIAVEAADVPGRIHVATGGEEARSILSSSAGSTRSPPVDLIVLDLDLPGSHGSDLLREIRADVSLKSIPVIVLSTSEEPGDIDEMYALGANAYLTKEMDVDETLRMVETLCEFWFETAEHPSR